MIGFSTDKQDICIGVYSISTINADKLEVITKYKLKTNIDIIILIDTRADKDAAKRHSTQARELLGQDCYVTSHPMEPTAALNIHKTKRVGGQMILAQPTWEGVIVKSTPDRSGL